MATRTLAPSIAHLVLDFDGTCTQVPAVAEEYLERYRLNFVREVGPLPDEEWRAAQAAVRAHAPEAGWTVAGCPCAPAAADPYILADESARHVLRRRGLGDAAPPASLNREAYGALPAPWRDDARDTLLAFIERGIKVHFVSNSSSAFITQRMQELFGAGHPALADIAVQSDAGKFRVCELPWEVDSALSPTARQRFQALPAAFAGEGFHGPGRPVYLRRGVYFEAICRVVGGDIDALTRTLFCGDIWEMDLAMPHALGACVHLLDRAAPFVTYPYEAEAVRLHGTRAKRSGDLAGLLAWI